MEKIKNGKDQEWKRSRMETFKRKKRIKVTIQYRSKHMLLRPYEYDSIVQNPISEADFKWILHRNCEGTEQLRIKKAGDRE